MKIKKQEFTEELFWAVPCPNCGEMIEVFEDPASYYFVDVECEMCGKTFEVED